MLVFNKCITARFRTPFIFHKTNLKRREQKIVVILANYVQSDAKFAIITFMIITVTHLLLLLLSSVSMRRHGIQMIIFNEVLLNKGF